MNWTCRSNDTGKQHGFSSTMYNSRSLSDLPGVIGAEPRFSGVAASCFIFGLTRTLAGPQS